MFNSNSRYADPSTWVDVTMPDGTVRNVVKFRRLPIVSGVPTTVASGDRLDIYAHLHYGDSTLFWHIGDANTELEAKTLTQTPGRVIQVPTT